ncbi:kinesin-like protein NACK1 isoform X2 [Ricinus communis]|uniref:kinesin-like protein NACK1 isoform X2 n=1 Tax=Ricinus communis TaxID=3988 RepID=UPI000772B5E4|nr:kinesin-like protein NACK1 isoform X2 [Ricinus communis]|eukprot:XP_015579652.1 kinesin-like protein NACK1 isoform X1 [Ricinus communis]
MDLHCTYLENSKGAVVEKLVEEITTNDQHLRHLINHAGSERASQTHADGARLREGDHINLSLITLTTVIRKLRSGHIPYGDSSFPASFGK